MREEYNFSGAKRENPYIDRIQQQGYAIVVDCGAAQANISDSVLSFQNQCDYSRGI